MKLKLAIKTFETQNILRKVGPGNRFLIKNIVHKNSIIYHKARYQQVKAYIQLLNIYNIIHQYHKILTKKLKIHTKKNTAHLQRAKISLKNKFWYEIKITNPIAFNIINCIKTYDNTQYQLLISKNINLINYKQYIKYRNDLRKNLGALLNKLLHIKIPKNTLTIKTLSENIIQKNKQVICKMELINFGKAINLSCTPKLSVKQRNYINKLMKIIVIRDYEK